MFFGPKTIPLDLSDAKIRLHIELERYEIDTIDDYDKQIQFRYRKNRVLAYYNYNDTDGNWGSVDEHYVDTVDLQRIASCFRALLLQERDSFEYETVADHSGGPFMVIECKRNDNDYYLRVQVAEGLFQEWVTVELQKLSVGEINAYAQVFAQWAKDYPVLTPEELAVAKEISW